MICKLYVIIHLTWFYSPQDFKNMIKTLDTRHVVPDCKHFSQIKILKLYGKVCQRMQNKVLNVTSIVI